jgi:hypothetical protein
MRCVAALAGLAGCLFLVSAGSVLAHDHSGGVCSSCHGASSGRSTVTSPTTVAALPGDLVSFTISVANANSTAIAAFTGKLDASITSGRETEPLTAVAGTADPNNKLSVVQTSADWSQPLTTATPPVAKNYYTSTASGAAFSTTFSFYVPAGTPADTYQMWMRASEGTTGVDPDKVPRWTEATSVSVTVGEVPEPATLAMLLGGALVGLVCWRGRKQLAAK